MPPKAKFTKEMVLNTAFQIVRFEGWPALSARNIASRLNSSVGPIYFFFESIKDLEIELIGKAYDLLYGYMLESHTDDPILNLGLGYIVFAREEKRLFKCFIDEKYSKLRKPYSEQLWQSLSSKFTRHQRYEGLSQKQVKQHRKKMIVFIYGMAVMISTDFPGLKMDNKDIEAFLRETGTMLLAGLKATSPGSGIIPA